MSRIRVSLPALAGNDIEQLVLGSIPEGSALWRQIVADLQQNPNDGEVVRDVLRTNFAARS
jgi:hypothetical protein